MEDIDDENFGKRLQYNECVCVTCLYKWHSVTRTEQRIICPRCHNNAYLTSDAKMKRMRLQMCLRPQCEHIWVYRGTKKPEERHCCPRCRCKMKVVLCSIKMQQRLREDGYYDDTLIKLKEKFPKTHEAVLEWLFKNARGEPEKRWTIKI